MTSIYVALIIYLVILFAVGIYYRPAIICQAEISFGMQGV